MTSIRKRTLKSGKISFLVDFKDGSGQRRAKQFATKADAVRYETRVRSEVASGRHFSSSGRATVAEAGALWLKRAERENLEAGTARQYRQHLNLHIVPLTGGRALVDMTPALVEEFRDSLVLQRSRPLARAVLTSLKGIFKEAKRLGLIGFNPAEDASVKLYKRDKQKVRIPSRNEIRAMLSVSAEMWPLVHVQTTRSREKKPVAIPWHPFLVAAIFTGLRCSELRGLTWRHVNLETALIQVRQRADLHNSIGAPKSAAGNRDVPMAPMVRSVFREWKNVCPATQLNLVFPTESGTIISNGNMHRTCWQPLLAEIGILRESRRTSVSHPSTAANLTFHSLRHAAASLFIEQGWSPKKIQSLMGHSSIQVTFDTYGHLWQNADDDLRAMANIEARLFGYAT